MANGHITLTSADRRALKKNREWTCPKCDWTYLDKRRLQVGYTCTPGICLDNA